MIPIHRLHFISIASTNTWAKKNYPTFQQTALTLVTADQQTDGRGRHQKKWISPPGLNLYATFCLFLDPGFGQAHRLSQLMAVSVAKILADAGFSPHFKWPNDLLLDGKKAAGILTESESYPERNVFFIGIGLNINAKQEDMQQVNQCATSLFLESGKTFEIEAILNALAKQFQTDLHIFLQEGFAPFQVSFREYFSPFIHTQIRLIIGSRIEEVLIENVNEDGSLKCRLNTGEILNTFSGILN